MIVRPPAAPAAFVDAAVFAVVASPRCAAELEIGDAVDPGEAGVFSLQWASNLMHG